jgi:hypothetical protein
MRTAKVHDLAASEMKTQHARRFLINQLPRIGKNRGEISLEEVHGGRFSFYLSLNKIR